MGLCYPCRDAVNDLALHFLAKMKIMVIKDIEREDIEFVCKVGFLGTASSNTPYTLVCMLIWHDIRNSGYLTLEVNKKNPL